MKQKSWSQRFIQEWREDLALKPTMFDLAIALTACDDRDIPFSEKLKDALAFIKSRIH